MFVAVCALIRSYQDFHSFTSFFTQAHTEVARWGAPSKMILNEGKNIFTLMHAR